MITATAEQIKAKCEAYAIEKYGLSKINQWEKDFQEVWYLPVLSEVINVNKKKVTEIVEGKNVEKEVSDIEVVTTVEKLGIFKIVDRHIMNNAQEKLAQGFYVYVEFMMRETLLNDDDEGNYIITNERAFLSAAPEFNKMVDGITTAFVKR